MQTTYNSIDEYIAEQPQDIQVILQKIRETVHESVPEATETIAYGMPAFKYKGAPLVYFAPFTNHVGFFPTSTPLPAFAEKLKEYKTSKGTVQFPLTKPIPYDLIKEITLYRAKQIAERSK